MDEADRRLVIGISKVVCIFAVFLIIVVLIIVG